MRCTCAVYGCLSTSYNKTDEKLRFHAFPKDEKRCRQWIKACQRPELLKKGYNQLKNLHICSLHFEEKMYAKMHLKIRAVPTLNFAPAERSISTQTDPEDIQISQDNSCPDESSSQKRIKLHRIDISKKQFKAGCDKFLNANLRTIVKIQHKLKFQNKAKRYSNEFKLFALNMYYESPHAYKFLAKTLHLPSKNALSSTYIPMTTHINKERLEALSTAASHMSPSQKECVMCMDVMPLKCSFSYASKQDTIVGLQDIDGQTDSQAARYAFTIMLRGITTEWKQPIGFAFISSRKINDELADWIINIINKLFEMGLQIRALISDHSPDFVEFAKSKGISTDQSHFIINGKKIYYIFDVPHIIKCIRNNLMKNDYEFNGKTACWDDIVTLYYLDVTKEMQCVPRLTDAHILPNNFQKQKIRYAVQVFSNSVVSAFETYTASEEMKPCIGTVEFFRTIDNLFDLLNSSDPHSAKPYGKPFRANDSQIELLDKAETMFKNLIVRNKKTGNDVTIKMEFINALLITMNSIHQLLLDMQYKSCVYLFTRLLNKDCFESFFGSIRQACKSRKPTCLEFTRVFRKSYFYQLMQLSNSGNYENKNDFDKILFKYNDFVKNNRLTVNHNDAKAKGDNETLPSLAKPCSTGLPETNGFLYVCGYVLRRCILKHRCVDMMRYVSIYASEPSLSNVRVCLRESEKNETIDVFIPNDFLNFFIILENALNESFTSFVGNNIRENITNHLTEIEFSPPCDCFPLRFLIRLYVQIRIKSTVKLNNDLETPNDQTLVIQHLYRNK